MMKILNRAKAIDETGGYIVSQSVKFENEKMFLYSIPFRQWVECDESTRSINFEDMLDSQGNKIFASLSEDGKGGDIVENIKCVPKQILTMCLKEFGVYQVDIISKIAYGWYPEQTKIIEIQE